VRLQPADDATRGPTSSLVGSGESASTRSQRRVGTPARGRVGGRPTSRPGRVNRVPPRLPLEAGSLLTGRRDAGSGPVTDGAGRRTHRHRLPSITISSWPSGGRSGRSLSASPRSLRPGGCGASAASCVAAPGDARGRLLRGFDACRSRVTDGEEPPPPGAVQHITDGLEAAAPSWTAASRAQEQRDQGDRGDAKATRHRPRRCSGSRSTSARARSSRCGPPAWEGRARSPSSRAGRGLHGRVPDHARRASAADPRLRRASGEPLPGDPCQVPEGAADRPHCLHSMRTRCSKSGATSWRALDHDAKVT